MGLSGIVEVVLSWVADYLVYLAVSFVLSLAIRAYREFVKSGR